MQITPNFSLAEMTRTQTGLENECPLAYSHNLLALCEMLEKMRAKVGPLVVNSGYRSPDVNRAVHGSLTSAHMYARAADVVPLRVSPAVLFDLAQEMGLAYDQIILEPSWVHIGVAEMGKEPRKEVLKAYRKTDGSMGYTHIKGRS